MSFLHAAASAVGGEDSADGPVLGGDEGFDFAFAFDDQADGDGLHPAGGEALGDFAPEQRADLVAHDAVEDSRGPAGR